MSVKVAINGFGRIGRLAFRQMFGAEGYEVVAINDLTSPKMLAHLLKYDSSQGRYVNFGEEDQVTADDEAGTITVKGKTIKIYKEPDANNCPWGEIGVDVVLECSGFYTSKAKAQAHINAGAEKVVISDLSRSDMAENIEDAFRYDRIILMASSYDGGVFPVMEDFLMHLKSKNYQNRKIGLVENGSWAPTAARVMKGYVENFKNVTIAEPVVTIRSTLNEASEKALSELAEVMAKGE